MIKTANKASQILRSSILKHQSRYFSKNVVILENPYTQQIIQEVPFINKEKQDEKLQKARVAFKDNRFRKMDDRIKIVKGLINHLRTNKEVISKEITECMGKPIVQSREEIDVSCERAEFFCDIAKVNLQKEIVEQSEYVSKYVIREPIGTVLLLSSFDFPILSSISHLVPAILCGNSVLIKDNPRTPLIGKHLQQGCGGSDLVQYFFAEQNDIKKLYKNQDINYVVFMGSLESAHAVYQEVANNDFIDVQLDLGGKEAAYVDPDADQELAINKLIKGAFYNTGQSRESIERIYVHKEISQEFINKYTKKVFEKLKVGDPMDETTNIGPIANLESIESYQEAIKDAISLGGAVLIGGNTNTDDKGLGRFYEPTVIANGNNGMRVMQDQLFGPIVGFQEVENEIQAKELINSSRYGLTASIFTNDQITMDYFVGSLQVGVVNFNDVPVMQDHYLPVTGRKLCSKILYNSKHAFNNFTKLKSVNIKFY